MGGTSNATGKGKGVQVSGVGNINGFYQERENSRGPPMCWRKRKDLINIGINIDGSYGRTTEADVVIEWIKHTNPKPGMHNYVKVDGSAYIYNTGNPDTEVREAGDAKSFEMRGRGKVFDTTWVMKNAKNISMYSVSGKSSD